MSKNSDRRSALDFMPVKKNLTQLRRAAAACEGCPLFANATQTVFGAGAAAARLVFVGEQPGDQEDRAGKPFIGPAGQLFDAVLAEVGLERKAVYVTNIVKHFKWIPRGKRRLHAMPTAREVDACRPWLEAEIAAIEPDLIVCLGATAAQGILGREFRVTRQRGEICERPGGPSVLATFHPSAILRAPDEAARHAMRRGFVHDLKSAAKFLQRHSVAQRERHKKRV